MPRHSQQNKLIWIASYPKSGNLWCRIFLANLLYKRNTSFETLHSDIRYISNSREPLNESFAIDSALLSVSEINKRRALTQNNSCTSNISTYPFFKALDAYTFLPGGSPLLGNPKNQSAIYIIRNPLDVATELSYKHVLNSADKAVKQINNPNMALFIAQDEFSHYFQQSLLSWSNHVSSWLENADMPIHVMRFEDMLHNSLQTFRAAANFAGLNPTTDEIQQALKNACFTKSHLKNTSSSAPTREVSHHFQFSDLKTNAFREILSQQQIQSITDNHYSLMEKFGYLEKLPTKLAKPCT